MQPQEQLFRSPECLSGGEGIRTLGDPKATPVFKTGAFNRSATPPSWIIFLPHARITLVLQGFLCLIIFAPMRCIESAKVRRSALVFALW